MASDACAEESPVEVFRTLAKIKAASYRVGFNIWNLYKPLDPHKNNAISFSKFVSVLAGPLKDITGISGEEIIALAEYFQLADGRVMYSQFCNYVQPSDEKQQRDENETKDDKEAPNEIFQRNELLPEEEKYLLIMLTKIAVIVKRKKMILEPYFQDYVMVKKSPGLVSRTCIARVLNQIGVQLSTHDYNLLLRKYSKDCFTVSYVALLKDLEVIRKYLEDHSTLDIDGGLLPKFAGRLDGWDLPQLPRPETVEAQEDLVGLHTLNKPQNNGLDAKLIEYTMDKIRNHLHKEKLIIEPLMKRYDSSDSGRMTQAQFRLVLAELSKDSNKLTPLTLTNEDVNELGQLYTDPTDRERILWRAFDRDVYQAFKQDDLKNWPKEREFYLKQICEKRKREKQAFCWAQMDHPAPPPDSLSSVLISVKKRLIQRNLTLKTTFLKYDREGMGFVKRSNLRNAMVDNCILCTANEYKLLEDNYLKSGLFSYVDMITDLDKTIISNDQQKEPNDKRLNNFSDTLEEENKRQEQLRECDIIEVLAKIKGKLICLKIRLRHYMKPLDKTGDGLLKVSDFTSILEKCNLELTPQEIDTVLQVFKDSNGNVEYIKFCNTVDEESDRPCLVRLPLIEEMVKKEKLGDEFEHPFLNYEERRITSVVVKKLSEKISIGQLDVFKALDPNNTGYVSKNQFMSQLHSMGILHTLAMYELDTIVKAFGVIPKGQTSYNLDYKSFFNAIDIVYRQFKASN